MSIFAFGKKASQVDSFETLLGEQLDGLYIVALRYTRDTHLAQDLVHDTALRALRFRDKFEPGTNFRAWVYTILTNTFIHRYRRQKREREILEGTSRTDVATQMESEQTRQKASQPEQSYLEAQLSDDTERALASLQPEFRAVVMMCDIQGKSYKEIALATKVPVGTVMSRLHRARRLLSGKLVGLAKEQGIVRSDARATA